MVNRFLSTFGAVAIFALLVSFGARDITPVAPVRTPAKAIAEIPITHHFSVRATVGAIGSGTPPPAIATLPPDGGLALSQFSFLGGPNSNSVLRVRINGVEVWKRQLPYSSNSTDSTTTIDPPLIVPPSALLELGTEGSSGTSTDLTITGYTLPAEYFGGP